MHDTPCACSRMPVPREDGRTHSNDGVAVGRWLGELTLGTPGFERSTNTPRCNTTSDRLLAQAGFSKKASSNLVECRDCGLEIEDHLQVRQALKLHVRRKPDCPFVVRHYGLRHHTHPHPPKYPQYEQISARRDSFQGWPRQYVPQSPENLTEAGFFYIGSADRVTCFQCGVTLRDWSEEHDAVAMHKEYSSTCEFIHKTDLIQLGVEPRLLPVDAPSVVVNTEENASDACSRKIDARLTREATVSADVGTITCRATQRLTGGKTTFDICTGNTAGDVETDGVVDDDCDGGFLLSDGASILRNKDAGSAEAMGFSMGVINRAHKNNPSQKDDVSEPIEVVSGLEMQASETNENSSSSTCLRFLGGTPDVHGTVAPRSPKRKNLKDANRRLRAQKTCHVCGHSDVSVLFLPCGHLVTCDVCAPRISTCIACNKAILATVKTYLT